jgi:hypothetical protein
MAVRDLIPWTRSRDVIPDFWREERVSPFFTFHREMNRLVDEVFRNFSSYPLAHRRWNESVRCALDARQAHLRRVLGHADVSHVNDCAESKS